MTGRNGPEYAPEEANLTLAMNFTLKKDEDIAREAGLSLEQTRLHLENMANKLILFSKKKKDGQYYSLLPLLPGIYEFPFMDGGGTPKHDELAKLWSKYYDNGLGKAFGGSKLPLARVISVEKTLPLNINIHTTRYPGLLMKPNTSAPENVRAASFTSVKSVFPLH